MNRNGFGSIFVVLGIFALAVIGGIGWVHYYYVPRAMPNVPAAPPPAPNNPISNPAPYTFIQHVSSTVTSSVAKVSIEADLKTTVSCGTENCFKTKFATCAPATLTSDAGWAAVSYKIIGPVAGGCKMTFMYTQNPNPAWVNQPMTCTYDNKIDFQTSIQNTFNAVIQGKSDCTGSLVKILRSQ